MGLYKFRPVDRDSVCGTLIFQAVPQNNFFWIFLCIILEVVDLMGYKLSDILILRKNEEQRENRIDFGTIFESSRWTRFQN